MRLWIYFSSYVKKVFAATLSLGSYVCHIRYIWWQLEAELPKILIVYPGMAIAILSRFILRASKNVTKRRKYGNCCFKLQLSLLQKDIQSETTAKLNYLCLLTLKVGSFSLSSLNSFFFPHIFFSFFFLYLIKEKYCLVYETSYKSRRNELEQVSC